MIGLSDIQDARRLIRNEVNKTPLVRSQYLSDLCGSDAYLKLENLQVTNAFKIRGALNRMMNLTPEEKARGVIAASSGNHAQAVAIGAEKLNLTATVVVPETTPRIKVEKIRKHNVELIIHGEMYDYAEQYARKLAKEKGATFVSSYNDPLVVAGQGTVGLEILEDLPTADSIIVPVSGGSVLSGVAIAAKSIKPNIKILGVQPETVAAMYHCLKAGKIINMEMRHTIADGLDGNIEQGCITFELIQRYVDEILLFNEDTIRKMIRVLWEKEGQVVEASGAISIAPIVEAPKRFTGKRTVAVITGGNIDDALFQDILATRKQTASS
ncbi:MAG TPA: threonine/serine dehydratase [Candidatus Acidoferrales bacterium]|nr:threonine/serine dehydratase [Candidatus Acidoferrales bacterium]